MSTQPTSRIFVAVCLLIGAATAHSAASIGDYVMARSEDDNFDRNYHFGGENSTSGPGSFAINDSKYSFASLSTNFGSMSGMAWAEPPIPARGSPTNVTQASAEASGEFQDSFHLSSASLPYGTRVTLLLTVSLSGTAYRTAEGTSLPDDPRVYAGWGFGTDYPLAALTIKSTGVEGVATALWTTTVGASFDLVGTLDVRTNGLAGIQSTRATQTQKGTGAASYFLDVVGVDEPTVKGSSWVSAFDARGPGGFGADVTVTTDSGWNYATPVPEPSSMALLVAGLAVIGSVSRRRAAPANG
ncbi:MAG: PEP-CTERM sorting domain-containing protein [Vicinamibacterales bacterium]